MRRIFFVVIVSFGIGIVFNVALTTTLSVTRYLPTGQYEVVSGVSKDGSWEVTRKVTATSLFLSSNRHKTPRMYVPRNPDPLDIVPEWSDFNVPTEEFRTTTKGGYEMRMLFAHGWPCLSMWCEGQRTSTLRRGYSPPTPPQGAVEFRVPGWLRWTTDEPFFIRNVPLRPIWSGTLINSALFGTITWVLFFGWRDLRRSLRWRRHLCGCCAYPIGSSQVCTECGASVVRRPPRMGRDAVSRRHP